MKVNDFFIENKQELIALSKLKLPIKKADEKRLLSMPITKQTTYYSFIQLWKGKILQRVFATRLFKGKPEYQEVERRIEGNREVLVKNLYYSGMNGYKCVWYNSKPTYYLFNMEKHFNKWESFYCEYYRVWDKPLFTLNDLIILDPSLKYCAWNGQPLINWVTVYRQYPEIEILSKLGLEYLFANSKVLTRLKEKDFKKYLVMATKEKNGFYTSGTDIIYGYKRKLSIKKAEQQRRENIDEGRTKRIIREIAKNITNFYDFIDKKKLSKYLREYYDKNNVHMNASSYMDMIKAEQYLKLDMTLEKNLFPHDFKYWHDFYTKRYTDATNKDIDNRIQIQADKYQKLEIEFENIKLILPTKTSEFIDEGKALKHCVGRMGYNKKMAEGKSLILFVRKKEKLEESYVTMEYDPEKKKIMQLYGYEDNPPEESIREIIYNKWLPKARRMEFAL